MNDATRQVSTADHTSSSLRELGAELAFTQDASGIYRAFYWESAERYAIEVEEIVGSRVSDRFKPLNITPYLERVERILESLIPERFSYPFRYQERYFLFELIVTPILQPSGKATQVLALGRLLPHAFLERTGEEDEAGITQVLSSSLDLHQKLLNTILGSIRRTLPPGSELYQKLLGEMARRIRRTLDLNTIWQETVNGLGLALGLSRCIICPYHSGSQSVRVVAEYAIEPLSPMQGQELCLAKHPYLSQALEGRSPLTADPLEVTQFEHQSILVVATCYQDRPNALIVLDRARVPCDPQCTASSGQPHLATRAWNEAEIELVHELAEQVGTAIAHATLYKELEQARKQAEEASRLKSQFLANTSHELRTPLNGMIGFLKLIMDGMVEDEEELEEFIREAHHSAVHLLNLINDILDIAKIEAGKMQLDLAPVKLNEVLSVVENHTRAQVQQKQLSFQVKQPPTEDEILVYANYQRLLQVMLNLVGNAIKFTHEGGITITTEILKKKVKVRDRELPGLVKVSVADTGIGVSLDKQDKLFQSFSQLDGERTRRYGGTGLGLAISQKLVEAMGGLVNFYSMGEGLGSTVTFTVGLYQQPVMISTSAKASRDFSIESQDG